MPITTPHFRRPVVFLAVVGVIAIAAGAFIALRITGGPGPTTAPQGSSYTEAVAGAWQRINPLYANTNDADSDLSQLVFAGLVNIGPTGLPVAGLADLPAISDGGRTYTFKIRPGAKWQDGEPVTSADVAFTIEQLTSPDFKGDPNLAAGWIGVKVATPSPNVVVVTLQQPSAPFLTRNATIGILPQHLLAKLTPAQLYDAPFNTSPIGAGPYRLETIDSQAAVLNANPLYVGGTPGIAQVRLQFYSDYSSALRALESGQASGLLLQQPVSQAQIEALRSVRNVHVVQPQGGDYTVLYLNNDNATFSDPRVREAISLAIDRKTLVSRVYSGIATPSSSPVAPGSWAYDGHYDQPTANVEKAQQLLAEAGWKEDPATHILVRNGAEFRFTIRTDDDPTRVAVANEVARQLEPLGIRTVVASTPFSVLRRDFLQDRKYDAAVADWAQGPDPDPYFGWHSSQIGPAGLNLANYSDSVADALIAKGRTSTAQDVRTSVYQQFQQIWLQAAPSVILAYPGYVYAYSSSIKGAQFGVLFTPSLRFANIQEWHQ
ncbi:peptide ABC transporter substrate-binding protein [bacterium]|nr:peptide ABC transporter substrate-binding protein [bacterium]